MREQESYDVANFFFGERMSCVHSAPAGHVEIRTADDDGGTQSLRRDDREIRSVENGTGLTDWAACFAMAIGTRRFVDCGACR